MLSAHMAMASRLESCSEHVDWQVLYVPSDKAPSKLVKVSELVQMGEPFLLLIRQVLYPHDLSLSSYPTHVIALFGVKVEPLEVPDEEVSYNMNQTIINAWKYKVDGCVALMVCQVPCNPTNNVLECRGFADINEDMSIPLLESLTSQFKTRSPADSFFNRCQNGTIFNRRLRDFLRPYPIVSPDSLWNYPIWSPKKIVDELCARLSWIRTYGDASARDIGAAAHQLTREKRQFWSKLEFCRKNENEELEYFSAPYVSETGPYQKKSDAEVAACVTFLSDYHEAWLKQTHPDLYESTRHLLQETIEQAAPSESDSEGANAPSSSLSVDADIPDSIKSPNMAMWAQLDASSAQDFFGNGLMLKKTVKPGNGPLLGVTCMLRVWVSILAEGDDGIYMKYTSGFQTLKVGQDTASFHPSALASMRIGESAYFLFSSSIVKSPSSSVLKEDSSPMLVALSIPRDAPISFDGQPVVLADATTTLDRRLKLWEDCAEEAKRLYNRRYYKLALDYYQMGLRELSHKNDMFIPGSTMLRQNIEWTEDLQEFKRQYIRNRIGAAACCIYIAPNEWPHHTDHWKIGDNAVEEGLLSCLAVLRLEPKHFVATFRKALLFLKGHKFQEAKRALQEAELLVEANSDENRNKIEQAKLKLQHMEHDDAVSERSFAKNMFNN